MQVINWYTLRISFVLIAAHLLVASAASQPPQSPGNGDDHIIRFTEPQNWASGTFYHHSNFSYGEWIVLRSTHQDNPRAVVFSVFAFNTTNDRDYFASLKENNVKKSEDFHRKNAESSTLVTPFANESDLTKEFVQGMLVDAPLHQQAHLPQRA